MVFEQVWGRFIAPDGSPLSGSVVFTPAFSFALDAEAVTLPAPVTVQLDTEGRVSASLQVPDESTQPTTWTWRACPRLRHAGGAVRLKPFSFELVKGRPVNLAEVTPVPTSTGEYVTQGKPGADGVGLAAITTEGGELVFTLTDGSESRIPVPKGVPGDDGKDGVGITTITLEDGELVFTLTDGAEQRLPAPVGEKGDDGKPGQPGKDGISPPAPTLRVGEVTTLPTGSTATAVITGEAPDYTLTLGVPQGPQGEAGQKGESVVGPPGPKGEPGNPGVLVLVGVGRPDTPSTLSPENRAAVSSALVGATFTSTDGAGVGAWAWVKTPTGWQVTYGDTGWRYISSSVSARGTAGALWVRRTEGEVTWYAEISTVEKAKDYVQMHSPTGFRYSRPKREGMASPIGNGMLIGAPIFFYPGGGVIDTAGHLQVFNGFCVIGSQGTWVGTAGGNLIFQTSDPWPATLPGAPA